MWQTDVAPEWSFEKAAQTLGLQRARDLWAHYDLQYKKRMQEAAAIEDAMAKERQSKTYIVNEELEGQAEWRMAKASYVDIYRATKHEKGCNGGELLEDSHYMKWMLERNPALKINSGSGKIMSGWTRELETCPIAQARKAGELQRKRREALQGGLVTA